MAEYMLYDFVKLANDLLGNNIETIVEIGARDCTETVEFHKLVPNAQIYTFECNPNTLPLCRKAVKGIKNIKLIEKAVSNEDGTVRFYPINQEKTRTTWEDGNPGASSLLKASGKYPVEDYVQDEVEVQATTLESFMATENVNRIDMLWMDIQGAELMALKGAGERLKDIGIIHSEVEFMEIYSGQPLFADIKKFLNRKGFWVQGFTSFSQYSADAVFVNRKLIPLSKRPAARRRDKRAYQDRLRQMNGSEKKISQLRPRTRLKQFSHALKKPSVQLPNKLSRKASSLYIKHRPWFSLRRISYYGWLREIKPKLGFDINLKANNPSSKIPLDVIIPATIKDTDALSLSVPALRKNMAHPIDKIFVVARKNQKLEAVASELDCIFIEESKFMPLRQADINYVADGFDRSGWLYQQLIKLSGDNLSDKKFFLIMDADTVFVRPQIAIYKNRPIFNHSDEYNQPYFDTYQALIGRKPRSSLSFISHYMIVDRDCLKNMKSKIETRHGVTWIEAILKSMDPTKFSAFSEYETYGNFYLKYGPKRPIRLYWFNRPMNATDLDTAPQLLSDSSRNFKSVSFHNYKTFKAHR